MPRTAREISESNIYHVILRGINQQNIFEDDEDKKKFLFELCQDKNSLNEFSKEIMQTQNPRETYDKYNEIAKQFVASHTFKG